MIEADQLVLKLLGRQAVSTEHICAGKNSKVYRVECAGGERYAVKFYMHCTSDGCSRLEKEWSALDFLNKAGVEVVPKPLAFDLGAQGAIYSFLEGSRISTSSDRNISEITGFLAQLKKLSACDEAGEVSFAAEACFSPADLVKNLDNRYRLLAKLPCSGDLFREMHEFLEKKYLKELGKSIDSARGQIRESEWNSLLPLKYRTLSPSDFGYHNALRGPHGKLYFLDFEYFGWDDPVKTVSDFLLHPAMNLEESEIISFYKGMLDIFGEDEQFEVRFKMFLPLFRLKWCLILLNEFFSETASRRRFASGTGKTDFSLRSAQLLKAEKFINRDKEIFRVLFP
ncbi:phosphotransferase [Maridesulfovibrio hydrothermalis]|uniref:Aminoglycoside phosphotransferase n=1 Tax=Maridesulfovibrio hydrothermalis AM13 = DSM 14728 TaxID=1121451 RepID=L0RB62_9BACT|nr:phosphotransferase [Maridesulfovibrio hydrothermalis]CCO23452.1 Aminoglycoside phosphotransferase [Maridesulfovibrio hydrothermalis AM13 = DSM 14728]